MSDVSMLSNSAKGRIEMSASAFHVPEIAPPRDKSFHASLLDLLPLLRQQAMALTRHRADAEDLVQAAVTNALAAQASFEPGTNFRAWMVRILRNRYFSNYRRRRETVDIDHAPLGALLCSGGQEEGLAFKELKKNIARLPSDSRIILLMITVQGMSYEEASEQLGIAVGTLKCRVFRARKMLREWMLGSDASPVEAVTEGQRARRSSPHRPVKSLEPSPSMAG